jgi:hypothetical protein
MAAISAIWSRKFGNLGLLNSAFLTLIPKKEDVAQVKDFHPISLVHGFAKLVTKILASRLAGRNGQPQPECINKRSFHPGQFYFMVVQ